MLELLLRQAQSQTWGQTREREAKGNPPLFIRHNYRRAKRSEQRQDGEEERRREGEAERKVNEARVNEEKGWN